MPVVLYTFIYDEQNLFWDYLTDENFQKPNNKQKKKIIFGFCVFVVAPLPPNTNTQKGFKGHNRQS